MHAPAGQRLFRVLATAPAAHCLTLPALPRLDPAYSHTPGSCTLVGLSAMFIRVAFTIWLFTVYCTRGR